MKESKKSFGKQNGTNNNESSGDEQLMRQIENTPFVVVRMEADAKRFICVGKYRLTEPRFESHEQAVSYLDANKWEIILQLVALFSDMKERKAEEAAKVEKEVEQLN